MKTRFTLALISALLTACSSVPLTSMYKLRNFDPLTQHPSTLQLAVIVPESIDLTSANIVMLMGFDAEEDTHDLDNEFKLSAVDHAEPPADLFYSLQDNERLVIVSFAKNEADRMRVLQSQIKSVKESDIAGQGYIGFNIHGFCLNKRINRDDLEASFYLQVEHEQDYIPVAKHLNLAQHGVNIAEIQCENWEEYQQHPHPPKNHAHE